MCMGSSDSATNAEQQQATQQQAEITGNVNSINSAFANRAPQYAQYQSALQQQYQTELNRQNTIAARNTKFGLASSGLTGGSAAADQGQLLGQDMATGQLNAQQDITGDVAKLQAADAATKQQMISLAQSGGDIGNAAGMTAQGLQANIGNAQSVNAANALGSVFGDVATNATNMNTAAQYRKGYLQGSSGTNNAAMYGSKLGM
jgi:hypothetical protein